MQPVKFGVGDTLVMKKKHPCGSNLLVVLRVGSDIKLKCGGCDHEFTTPRIKIEKSIKEVRTSDQT